MSAGPVAVFHPSNALTYVSLAAAIVAIAGAVRGSAATAGAFIAISVVADTFDGRFARLFVRTAQQRTIGVQLDSLCDAIAFGVTPGICVTLLAPAAGGWLAGAWWCAFALFAACAVSRLAFFNATHEQAPGFVGLPVPVAALIWSSLLLVELSAAASVAALVATAAAMILPLRLPRPTGAGLAVFVLWPLGVVVAHLT